MTWQICYVRLSDFNGHSSLAPIQGCGQGLTCVDIEERDCAKIVSWNDINDIDYGCVTLIIALASVVSGCSI